MALWLHYRVSGWRAGPGLASSPAALSVISSQALCHWDPTLPSSQLQQRAGRWKQSRFPSRPWHLPTGHQPLPVFSLALSVYDGTISPLHRR